MLKSGLQAAGDGEIGKSPARSFPRGKTRSLRFEGSDFARRPDCRTQLSQRGELPASSRLDEDIAKHSRLDRTRQNGAVAGISGELVEQIVARAAADDVDDFNLLSA